MFDHSIGNRLKSPAGILSWTLDVVLKTSAVRAIEKRTCLQSSFGLVSLAVVVEPRATCRRSSERTTDSLSTGSFVCCHWSSSKLSISFKVFGIDPVFHLHGLQPVGESLCDTITVGYHQYRGIARRQQSCREYLQPKTIRAPAVPLRQSRRSNSLQKTLRNARLQAQTPRQQPERRVRST